MGKLVELGLINRELGIIQATHYVQKLKSIEFNEAKDIVDHQLNMANNQVGNSQSNLGGIIFLLGGLIVILIIIVKLKGC